MILTPDEQRNLIEEMDYQIDLEEGKKPEERKFSVWDSMKHIASNPTLIALNEKAKQMNARLCEQEAQAAARMERERYEPTRQRRQQITREPRRAFAFNFDDDHL